MTMLMRFDPFRELDRLAQPVRPVAMPMDAYREGDDFIVHIDLPGVDPDAIELTVEKNVLTVAAERSWSIENQVNWLAAERPQGRYSRQLFLGESLDPDRIEAAYDRGVLTIRVPVAEAAKPRRVAVTSGGGKSAIDATSSAA